MKFINRFIRNIFRIIRWAPAIYRLEAWDHAYSYKLFSFVLQELQNFYGNRNKVHITEPARLRILKEITIAKNLLRRLANGEYPDFDYDAVKQPKISFISLGDNKPYRLKTEFDSEKHQKKYNKIIKQYFERQAMLQKQD